MCTGASTPTRAAPAELAARYSRTPVAARTSWLRSAARQHPAHGPQRDSRRWPTVGCPRHCLSVQISTPVPLDRPSLRVGVALPAGLANIRALAAQARSSACLYAGRLSPNLSASADERGATEAANGSPTQPQNHVASEGTQPPAYPSDALLGAALLCYFPAKWSPGVPLAYIALNRRNWEYT